MLEISWLNGDRSMSVRVPIGGADEERLGVRLSPGDWPAEEALSILAEALAITTARFARARTIPPSQQAIACAARAIASRPVRIPNAAMRDRVVMADFLRSHGARDADCSAAMILHGRPASPELPLPQSPYVVRRLARAGHVRGSR